MTWHFDGLCVDQLYGPATVVVISGIGPEIGAGTAPLVSLVNGRSAAQAERSRSPQTDLKDEASTGSSCALRKPLAEDRRKVPALPMVPAAPAAGGCVPVSAAELSIAVHRHLHVLLPYRQRLADSISGSVCCEAPKYPESITSFHPPQIMDQVAFDKVQGTRSARCQGMRKAVELSSP